MYALLVRILATYVGIDLAQEIARRIIDVVGDRAAAPTEQVAAEREPDPLLDECDYDAELAACDRRTRHVVVHQRR